jgi:hypothetical protein
MSGIGYWNPARKPDMFEFSGKLECKEFFDDLHFTNSLNAPPPRDGTELIGHR